MPHHPAIQPAQDSAPGAAWWQAHIAVHGNEPSLADYAAAQQQLERCPSCLLYHSADTEHVCVEYNGPPCSLCSLPTTYYSVGAPGYGSGRVCPAGHAEALTPHGIYSPEDVR